ncbi:MAG: hypothetical protein ACAH83_15040 [Alphaproteobacteria bacterium]
MAVREVNISEFLAAGEEGKALLELAAKANISFKADVTPTKKFNLSTGQTREVDVSRVWFGDPYAITVIRSEGGGTSRESGISGQSNDGIPDALRKLFNQLTRGNATVEVTGSDQQKIRYRYSNGFQQTR